MKKVITVSGEQAKAGSQKRLASAEISAKQNLTHENPGFYKLESLPESNPEAFSVPEVQLRVNMSVLALNIVTFELPTLPKNVFEYPCLLRHCNKSFPNKYAMRRHILTHHKIHRPSAYSCVICGDLFMSEKSLFDVCLHGYAKHYNEELNKQDIRQSLRYLNRMGEDMHTGHFDVLSLLRRIGLKFDELVPVWFPAHFSIQSSESLQNLEEDGVLSFGGDKWHCRNAMDKVKSKRAGTVNLWIDSAPVQNRNMNKEISMREIEGSGNDSARMLVLLHAAPPAR